MKNYVTGWRQQVQKEVAKQTRQATPPQAEAQIEPTASPVKAPRKARQAKAAPPVIEGEVVEQPKQRRIRMPSLGVPRLPMEWLALGGAIVVYRVSTDATYAAARDVGLDVSWWQCLMVQVIIGVVERFMFAGNVNLFTVIVLFGDALINAWGVAIDLLPGFFGSGLWRLLSGPWPDLSAYTYASDTVTGLVLALACGAFLAWSGDKLLDIAMRR